MFEFDYCWRLLHWCLYGFFFLLSFSFRIRLISLWLLKRSIRLQYTYRNCELNIIYKHTTGKRKKQQQQKSQQNHNSINNNQRMTFRDTLSLADTATTKKRSTVGTKRQKNLCGKTKRR